MVYSTPRLAAKRFYSGASVPMNWMPSKFAVVTLKHSRNMPWKSTTTAEVNQYAQQIISTPGKHDGLAWRNAEGNWEGPVAEGIAKAIEQGYTNKQQPYHGYYFKILKGRALMRR